MKVYEPNILTGILALKFISNKYKYLIFMRELDALLYAEFFSSENLNDSPVSRQESN